MQTGEDEQGLRKILDLTRVISISILIIHFYYYCYAAFSLWKIHSVISDRVLQNIYKTGLFNSFNKSKIIALLFLIISLIGAAGQKDERLSFKISLRYIIIGLVIYFSSYAILYLPFDIELITATYMIVTAGGFILVLTGGTLLSRIITVHVSNSVFNSLNETFPQEERLMN